MSIVLGKWNGSRTMLANPVADFHTYFITDRRLLSHDNTPRQPTQSTLPGLQP